MYSFSDVHANPCFYDVGSSNGVISSSANKNYSMYDCTWIITAPSNHTVKLNFTIFNLLDLYPRIFRSEIKVFDGKRKNDTLLGIFSGSRRPFIVQTSGKFMMLTFKRYHKFAFFNFKGVYSSTSIKGELYVPRRKGNFQGLNCEKTSLVRIVKLYDIYL